MQRWERFMAGPTEPPKKRIYVSINKGGVILMNKVAYEMLNAPEAIVIYFDRQNSMIGLEGSHNGVVEAFPVTCKEGHWHINASPFCRNHRIKIDRTERFAQPDVSDEGILRLDLTKTVSTAHRNRRPNLRRGT